MADTTGTTGDALIERIREAPWAFDFFQAIRRLEAHLGTGPGLGRSQRLSEDPLRLGQDPDLRFAPSTLSRLTSNGQDVPRLKVQHMGLFGPNGPLPFYLTEYAQERQLHAKDGTLIAFLDVFHHRLLSLFYRAWAESQPTVHFDRGLDNALMDYVGSVLGLGFSSLRGRDALPDRAPLYYAGHLASPTRHAEGLRAILEDELEMPVEVQQFVGAWTTLPSRYHCRLGEDTQTGTLGELVLGDRIWDCQQGIRLRLGPMSLASLRRLLPGGDLLGKLVSWVKLYVRDGLRWDIQLILRAAEVPMTYMGGGSRLGWTSWLGRRQSPTDADDLVFRPEGDY